MNREKNMENSAQITSQRILLTYSEQKKEVPQMGQVQSHTF
jgi:hypothetical protein